MSGLPFLLTKLTIIVFGAGACALGRVLGPASSNLAPEPVWPSPISGALT